MLPHRHVLGIHRVRAYLWLPADYGPLRAAPAQVALQNLTGDRRQMSRMTLDGPTSATSRHPHADHPGSRSTRPPPRLYEENINYGFWRNLLGLKPFALTSLVALLAIDGITLVAGRQSQMVGVAAGLHVLCLIVWLVAVRPDRVLQQGRTYAERLFETLDHESPAR